MNKLQKHRRYRLGNHLIATTKYHQFYDYHREWGFTVNRNENTWTIDLYLGATIKVLYIKRNYFV